jgi:PAS domain S-box-containing protein
MNDQLFLPAADINTTALHDPARLQALRRTKLLDSIAEEEFDRLVRLAVRVLRVPVALVSLVDSERQFFKSCLGLGEPWASQRETPLSHSFCQHAVISREPLIIEDSRKHPLVHDNLAIPDLNVIAYAGIPLITRDGAALGSFCAIDTVPRAWSDDEIAILKDLAAAVMTEIELRLAMGESELRLAEAERERAEKTAILESITDAFFTLDAEWCFTYLNDETACMLQRSRTDLLGRSIWEAFPEMLGTPFHTQYQRARAEGSTVNFEAFYPPLGRWFQVRAYPSAASLSVSMHDITHQRAEELAARERAQRLRIALDAANMGTWDWDLQTNRVYLPPDVMASQQANHQNFDEIFNSMLEMVHPDDRASIDHALNQALATQAPFKVQVRVFDQHGTLRWRHIEGRAIVDEFGRALRVAGIDMDINAQKEAELALRSSEERLARILETNASGILFLSERCEVVFANSAAEQILGLAPNTLVGTLAEAFDWKFETVGGQPLPSTALPVMGAFEHGTHVYDAEFAFVRPDGQRVILVANAAPVRNAAGHIEGVVVSFMDQTARKRETETQRFLARAAALLNSSLDYEATLAQLAALVVPTLADWCTVHLVTSGGVQHIAAAHVDSSKVPLIHALQASYPYDGSHKPSIADGLRLGQTVFVPSLATSEHAPLLSRGREAELRELGWESLIAVPLVARGQMLGMISFVRACPNHTYSDDDRKLAEELAGRAAVAVDNALLYQQARQAVIARDGLFSMVTHDLKNPLTAIKGYTELIKRRLARGDTDPARFNGGLANIASSVAKIERQLSELADTSMLHSGRPLDLAYVPSDLGVVVRQVADEMRPSTRLHSIEVRGTTAPLIGMVDPARIERVFANLLANAIKYSPNGGAVTVTLADEMSKNGRQAVINVHDQGIGIPADELGRIFEQFTRASNVGAVAGTGVGLASARQIVEQHGGTIEVSSSEGVGSTFTVRLPLYEEETRAAGS